MGSIKQLNKQFPSQWKSDCSNVYGSRFAAGRMPTQKLPDNEMPRDVAYQLIKDELALDGQPMLKFVYISSIKN
jgi:glutamate decarboxylase